MPVQAYTTWGSIDNNCPHSIYNAWLSGVRDVDIYIYPNSAGGDALYQVSSILNYLGQFKIISHGTPPGQCQHTVMRVVFI